MNRLEIESLAALVAKQVAEQILANATPGRWLTFQEAKKYCKVKSDDTLRSWLNKGLIYGHKRTGEWIIDRESIDAYFNSERIAC